MQILENDQLSDIIAWHPNGEGFIVKDKERLESEVLPSFCREAKYTSFNRRLKRWDFRIQRRGHKKSSYFHPLFFRNDYESLKRLHPLPQKAYHKKSKAAKAKSAINVAAERTIERNGRKRKPQNIPQATNSYSRNSYGVTQKKIGMHDARTAVQQDIQGHRGLRQGVDIQQRRSFGLKTIADRTAISTSTSPFVSSTSNRRGEMPAFTALDTPAFTAFEKPVSHLASININNHLNQHQQISYMPSSYQSDSLPAPIMRSNYDPAVMSSHCLSRTANYGAYGAVPSLPTRPQMVSFAPPPIDVARMDYNVFPQTDTAPLSFPYNQFNTTPRLNGDITDRVSTVAAFPYRNY
eukprot:scaffold10193_cov238-Chaetoceros_neogracile.AAC.2